MIRNFFKHLHLINKHKWIVFKLTTKVGIPIRGLLHDLSKYSPTEFWESVKYFQGNTSPTNEAIKQKGYSKAVEHHVKRNKHHPEYWYNSKSEIKYPIIPYKYVAEMICDNLAANMVYNGKAWNQTTQKEYWEKNKDRKLLNPKIKALLTEVFSQVAENGIDKTLNKKNIKNLYTKFTE